MKTTEQNEIIGDTVETFTRMSEVTLSSIERLTALNLTMARESLQQGVAASVSLSNGKGQDKVQNLVSEDGAERVIAYVRGLQEVLTDAQVELAQLIGKHISSSNLNGLVSFPGIEVFGKIVQQTSELTKASIRGTTEATEKLVATTSQPRRKSA